MSFTNLTLTTFWLLATVPASRAADQAKPSPSGSNKPTSPVELKPRDAATAMKEFKEEIASIRQLGAKMSGGISKDKPATGLRMMKVVTAKLAAVRTLGLPEDLRSAYDRMAKFWKATSELYADMPEEDAAVEAWAKKKFSDPKFAEKYKPMLMDGKAAGAELTKIAQTYRIEIELRGK